MPVIAAAQKGGVHISPSRYTRTVIVLSLESHCSLNRQYYNTVTVHHLVAQRRSLKHAQSNEVESRSVVTIQVTNLAKWKDVS